MSPRVRRAARAAVESVERSGVDSVTFATSGPNVPVTVTRADAVNFRVEDPTPLEEVSTTGRTARVQPVSVHLERESWGVTEGAGTFTARVEDEAFLRQLDEAPRGLGRLTAHLGPPTWYWTLLSHRSLRSEPVADIRRYRRVPVEVWGRWW